MLFSDIQVKLIQGKVMIGKNVVILSNIACSINTGNNLLSQYCMCQL